MMNTEKVLSLAAKLLAMQESRGATEAEASLAAERLQRLLQDHNLTLSQIEAQQADGESASKRVKDEMKSYSSRSQQWRAALLKGIGRNNFCLVHLQSNAYTTKEPRLLIIGREVNTAATRMTYEYLAGAFVRAAGENGLPLWHKETRRDFVYFMDGAVSRVVERLDLRRRERELEDAERAKTPTGNGSHKELVLSDVYGSEADLNNDALNGYPPGTTAARQREYQERCRQQKAQHDQLVAEGVDDTVAWYRAYGYSEEEATTAAVRYSRQQRRGGRRHRATNWSRSDQAEYRKVNSESYKAGRRAGNDVGLDGQVGSSKQGRIR